MQQQAAVTLSAQCDIAGRRPDGADRWPQTTTALEQICTVMLAGFRQLAFARPCP